MAQASEAGRSGAARWGVVLVLAAAQFIMVLDTTVMNVSITNVVADLDTTVSKLQLAITAYTLVMAAFMLTGGKMGDILGRRRAFGIGLVVYGIGSLTTALSPNIEVLLIGWSLVEGIGATLVIPAIAALIAGNYEGKGRAMAYGIIGGIAAAGAAAGPLIGGWVTTAASWRWVFAGETVVIVLILPLLRIIKDLPRPEQRPRIDLVGMLLSAAGMALVVLGILQSSTWGAVKPRNPPEVNGHELTPLGFSPVPFVVLGGLVVLGLFAIWERRLEARGGEPLLKVAMLRIEQLRSGLVMLGFQQLVIAGMLFVLPLYLQVVLGNDALETGIKILPLSIAMFVLALSGPKLAERVPVRRIVQMGLALALAAAVVLLATVDAELNETGFAVGMALFGAGVGLVVSQLGNVIMSSVGPDDTSEAGGLQGTAQNLGASLGTALIGAILLAGLVGSFQRDVEDNPALPVSVQQQLRAATEQGIEFVPSAQVEQIVTDAGLPPQQVDAVVTAYEDAQILALKAAMGAAAIVVLLALWFSRRLPAGRLGERAPPEAAPGPAAA